MHPPKGFVVREQIATHKFTGIMLYFLRLFFESMRFATKALRENLLRTTLSLLGVTIGIFAIISVLTVVDTLDSSIKKSLSFLGANVIYVEKWPWSFGPGYPWWKYMNRPEAEYEEYEFLRDNLVNASAISVFDDKGGLTLKHDSYSISNVSVLGVSHSHYQVSEINIEQGRYFTLQEAEKGANVVLVGSTIASELFPKVNPIGKELKIKGIKFRVIGLLERQGENLLDAPSNDDSAIIPYISMAKMFASGSRGMSPRISVKGFDEDKGLMNLEGEVQGMMRRLRGQRPIEEDSFALNRPEMFAEFLESIIGVLKIAGWCIGSFSILVGGFGIANIMFVSVKERTNLIGIQKSLGAKNYFILLQFLFESLFLSFIGGGVGLLLVNVLSAFSTETFIIRLTFSNIMIGLAVSSCIGILSGIIPAVSASRMNPVIAIRSK